MLRLVITIQTTELLNMKSPVHEYIYSFRSEYHILLKEMSYNKTLLISRYNAAGQ